MDHYVKDQVVIVTGGSSGFGLEAARILLEMGAKVAITGRNRERLDEARKQLAHDDLLAVRADAVKTKEWIALVQKVVKRWGRIDVLVNNHGAGVKIAEVESMEDADIEAVLDINIGSVIKGVPRGSPGHEAAEERSHRQRLQRLRVSFMARLGASTRRPRTAWSASPAACTKKWPLGAARPPSFIPGAAQTHFCDAAGICQGLAQRLPRRPRFR